MERSPTSENSGSPQGARRINVYVPGILTLPGDAKNWCGRAVTFTHTSSDFRAEKVEYLSGPGFTRSLFQKHRASKLARTLSFYSGWNIRVIAHSNGGDVVLDALQSVRYVQIEQIHFVCAACEADFEKNGMNYLLRNGVVDSAFVYVAGKDNALLLARSPLGHLFGFGTLGLHGAQDVDPDVRGQVAQVDWPELGHSDCWSAHHFNNTMGNFLRV